MQNQNIMKIIPAQVDIDLTNVCNQIQQALDNPMTMETLFV
jgi:hypothetical protein